MELGLEDILFHVEKTNTSALRLYERLGYKIFRDDGNRYLMKRYIGRISKRESDAGYDVAYDMLPDLEDE